MKFLAMAILASAAWASNVACPASPAALTPSGCSYIDLNFSNFAQSGSVSGHPAPTPASPTLSQIDLQPSGAIPAPSITLTAPASKGSCGTGSTLWCIDRGGSQSGSTYTPGQMISTVTYNASVIPGVGSPPPGMHYATSGLSLALVNAVEASSFFNNTNSSLTVYENFCVDASTVSGCSAANSGYIYEQIYNSGGTFYTATGSFVNGVFTPGTLNAAFGTGYTQIAIQDPVTLTWVNGGRISLDGLTNTFDESAYTPEPSTQVLAGGFLVGMVFWKLKLTRVANSTP